MQTYEGAMIDFTHGKENNEKGEQRRESEEEMPPPHDDDHGDARTVYHILVQNLQW